MKEHLNIDWNRYELANSSTKETFTESFLTLLNQFDKLEESEMYQLLYAEILPDLKLGYKSTYSLTLYFVDEIYEIFKTTDNTEGKRIILEFLTYVLRDFIRDRFKIWVYPYPFQLDYDGFSDQDLETSLFLKVGELLDTIKFEELSADKLPQFIYYLFIFKTAPHANSTLDKASLSYVTEESLCTVLLGNILHSFYTNTSVQDILPADFQSEISQYEFCKHVLESFIDVNKDRSFLLDQLTSTEALDTLWANGYKAILAATVLMLKPSLDQKSEFLKIGEAYLLHEAAVNDMDPEEIPDFPLHKYLMEDVTAIVFRDLYGKAGQLHTNELTEFQGWVIDYLTNELKIHTHSMLFSGISPTGSEDPYIDDPYSLYK